MKQPADYSGGGPGSSMGLHVGWNLDVAIAIIPIVACGPPG